MTPTDPYGGRSTEARVKRPGGLPVLRRASRRCAQAGLSVVEALIVVAVLAVLAILLLPAASRMATRAENLKCVSKLRGLHVILTHYATDHNGFLPVVQNDLDQSRTWLGYLTDKGYLSAVTKTTDPRLEAAFCSGSRVRDERGRADRIYANYGMNVRVGGRIRTDPRRTAEPKPIQSFTQPSRIMLVADAGMWMLYETVLTGGGGAPALYLPGVPGNASFQWTDRFREDAVEGRHGGVINAVMLDGHVQSIRAGRLQVSDFWEEP